MCHSRLTGHHQRQSVFFTCVFCCDRVSQGAGDDHILRRQSHDQRQTHQAQLQHTADMGLKQISRQISAEQGEHRKKGRYSQRITTPAQVPFPLRHPQDTFTRSGHTERYSSIHYTYTDTFIHSLYPHKYLQLLTAPMRIPLFIHYTCMDTFIHSLHLHGYLFFCFFLLSHQLCRPQRHCSRAARPGIPHLQPHPGLSPHRGPTPRGPQEVTSDRW